MNERYSVEFFCRQLRALAVRYETGEPVVENMHSTGTEDADDPI